VISDRSVTVASGIAKTRLKWHFAGSVLDARSLELTVHGADVEIERKPLEVLIYLLQHAGEVCTKDELLAGVWPGRVLSETVLTKCIGRLREALGDEGQEIIKTAYGFGYRFAAAVRIESEPIPEPSRFDFRPGDHPPGRPLWSLVERLGVGGHGEAWRGRHDKTGEQRAFKFALDEESLGALKREITLFRVINDTVGPEAPVVRLLDWNLEQPPYFVEAEFVTGGSLIDWARSRGGLTAIPLDERIDLVARIAEALAAVHSVGVLHKDLKPSNVLARPLAGQQTEVVLADFGSGSVLDVAELERLGITRLGFTKTMAATVSSGTPMYLAPEIIAGQPFTVKADIYALGVILYQIVVGDFNKLMSPGWERDIADELLRQDIATLAEGDPLVRLGDAEMIARNLRTIRERRQQLIDARAAEAEADRTRRLLERARARRVGLLVAFSALVIGLTASILLFLRAREARAQSDVAAARSKAVTEFLSQDVFEPVSSGKDPVKDIRVKDVLLHAAKRIDVRFSRQPEVASELHFIVGRSLNEFYETDAAVAEFKRALDLGQLLHGEGSISALRSAAELVELDYTVGQLPRTISRYESTLAAGRASLPANSDALLNLRHKLVNGRLMLGDWALAASQAEALLDDMKVGGVNDRLVIGRANLIYGQALTYLGRSDEGEARLRASIRDLSDSLGSGNPEVTDARGLLGVALTGRGQYDAAREQLNQADEMARRWEPEITWRSLRPRLFTALLDIEIDQPERAKPFLKWIVDFQDEHAGENPELDHTGSVRQALGEILLREGTTVEALKTLETAARVSALADGEKHPLTRSIRLSYGEALLSSPDVTASLRDAATFAADEFSDLPALHPFVLQRNRLRGLLALREGNRELAAKWFRKALEQSQAIYGGAHWRTARLQSELQRATR